MRNSLFFLILFSLPGLALAQAANPHADHGHSEAVNEFCKETSSTSDKIEKLSKEIAAIVDVDPLHKEFCEAVSECRNLESSSYDKADEATKTFMKKSNLENLKYCLKDKDSYTLVNKTCGLDWVEGATLKDYMGSGYTCLNKSLWGQAKLEKVSFLIKQLKGALQKFPAYQGFVARGTTLPDSILKEHQVGAIVTYKAFTSSSTDLSTAKNFAGNSMFLIYSSTGRPIMSLNGMAESEVLFNSGTKFRVLKMLKHEVGTSYFIMREVSGTESASKQKKEDARILALAESNSKPVQVFNDPDAWSCPAEGAVPKVVPQKNMPRTNEFFEETEEKVKQEVF